MIVFEDCYIEKKSIASLYIDHCTLFFQKTEHWTISIIENGTLNNKHHWKTEHRTISIIKKTEQRTTKQLNIKHWVSLKNWTLKTEHHWKTEHWTVIALSKLNTEQHASLKNLTANTEYDWKTKNWTRSVIENINTEIEHHWRLNRSEHWTLNTWASFINRTLNMIFCYMFLLQGVRLIYPE